jgi:hypothetical protein
MIAKDHKLRIIKRSDRKIVAGVVGYIDVWIVYRILAAGASTRLGKTSKPERLLRMVKTFAGVTDNPPQPRAA